MVEVQKLQELQKRQEANSFIGRKGPTYVSDLATQNERKHFEGTIYKDGIAILKHISYFTSPLHL